MAVIHIPEAEAVVDFRAVLRQVDSGDRIIIDRPGSTLELLAAPSRGKTVAEAISILKDRGHRASEDLDFADDLQAAIDSMRALSTRPSPWGLIHGIDPRHFYLCHRRAAAAYSHGHAQPSRLR